MYNNIAIIKRAVKAVLNLKVFILQILFIILITPINFKTYFAPKNLKTGSTIFI